MRLRARSARLNAKGAQPAKKTVCALCVLCVLFVNACSSTATLFRQYEYEEEVYLSLDGSATVYVNSSLPALNALRGMSLDTSPGTRVDIAAVRASYSSPVSRVIRVSQSRRNNRRFVHIRIEIDDVRKLGDVAPFAWSTYQFQRDGDLFVYRQKVGAAVGKDVGTVGWNGSEIAAFRLHLPSKIRYHNTKRDVGRGNILVWEQSFAERLRSVPIVLDARMDAQSILYTTLWLFGVTFLAVAVVFGGVIWWVMRRGTSGVG